MSLEQWLRRATRSLSAESRAKVRAEIEEHYRTALQEPGASESSALASLGDPAAANREYRKVLLTSAEARMLRETKWESTMFCTSRNAARFLLPLILLAVAMSFFTAGQTRLGAVFAICATGVSILMSVHTLPLFTRGRGRIFRLVRWAWLGGVLLVAGYGSPVMWALFPTLICMPIYYEWMAASLRRKLPVEQWPRSLYL